MKNKELYIKRLVIQGMTEEEATKFVNLIENDALTTDETYYIKVEYTSGDSFSTYETAEDIDLHWHNLGIVKENLRRLEEQMELYNNIDSYFSRDTIEENKRKWANANWAVFYKPGEPWSSDGWEVADKLINRHSIKLLKDDGTEFQISTYSWMGYFEHNQSFSIERVNEHNKFN